MGGGGAKDMCVGRGLRPGDGEVDLGSGFTELAVLDSLSVFVWVDGFVCLGSRKDTMAPITCENIEAGRS